MGGVDGVMLAEMQRVLAGAPEYFFGELKTALGIPFFAALRFSAALRTLGQ